MDEQQKLSNSKDVIQFLATSFPKCFSLEGDARPLKIGIFQDLAERLSDDDRVSKTMLRSTLRHYTSSWRYLHSVQAGQYRVDLDGNDNAVVEQDHADHAKTQLDESKAKAAEKRLAKKKEIVDQKKASAVKKTINKRAKPIKPKTPSVKTKALESEDLTVGKQVSVKVGKTPMPAVITEVAKDGIQVQLNSGMMVKVQLEQLRLILTK